jgi:hypothetical protein
MFNVNFKEDRILRGRLGRRCALLIGMIAGATGLSAQAATTIPFVAEGTQYAPVGSPLGDQMAPSIAFRANGGCLVWHDNLTDGDGFGISARRLSGQLSGLSSLRVNEDSVGDQENPQVAILADGSNLIVWQSGPKNSQKIVARVLQAGGRFSGPEFVLSAAAEDNRNPSVAVAGDGTVIVVWSAEGADGSMSAVQGRRLTPAGNPQGEAFILNQATKFNQRDPVVSTTGSGDWIVVWISEHQRFENSVDVIGRRLGSDGVFFEDEMVINTSRRPCTTPTVAGLPGRGFVASWAEHQDVDSRFQWDIAARVWGDLAPVSSDFRVNSRQNGFQIMPRLAVSANSVFVIYRSAGGDGYGEGVVGRWLATDGSILGDELVVNSRTSGDQMTPTLAADSTGRVVVVWSTFGGISKGMDLAAQRYARPQAPLPPPGSPYLFAASSSRILVTWPEVGGLGVVGYEIYVDGATTPLKSSEGSLSLSGFAPSSTHTVRVGYVLADGRRSPLSVASSGKTWGEDDNADGLPDDWQKTYFGTNSDLWPGLAEDSDSDGVSNRNEFLAGTDPNDAASFLHADLIATSQGPLLTWNSRPGAIYQPQWSSNLRDWNNLGSPRLAATTTDSTPAGETPASSYYRVNLLR